MSENVFSVFSVTCFLIASKYDEIDDRLVFINDVKTFFNSSQGVASLGKVPIPSWNDIVECERLLLYFFNWDIGFVIPYHFIEMFLANGVLFKSDKVFGIGKNYETAEKISAKSYELLNSMVRVKDSFKN